MLLRRKLIFRMGVLVLGFVAGAVVAIVMLQRVLRDLDAMTADAAFLMDGVVELSDSLAQLELHASEVLAGQNPLLHAGANGARSIDEINRRLGEHPLMRSGGAGAESYSRFAALIGPHLAHAADLVNSRSPDAARAIQEASPIVRREAAALARIARTHVAADQHAVSRELRLLVIALTAAALVMVNVAVVVLLRTGQMILRPVEALVRGSRELARERFDHRVRLDARDEFGELAGAYNTLAEQLQANEFKKVEALKQVATTLNHELNNAINIIELQLSLLDRRTGGDPAIAGQLRTIRENLGRMTETVASLKNVRRVVLTDYGPSMKMLDLRESVREVPLPISTNTLHEAPTNVEGPGTGFAKVPS